MFVKLHRISTEPLASSSENVKYACLVNRGVLFENASLQVGVITKYNVTDTSSELNVLINLYNKSPHVL